MTTGQGFRVMSEMCQTCIFGAKSPISQERFEELKRIWERKSVVQECHVATIQDERVACRGHFNMYLTNPAMPYPLDGIQQELGLSPLSRKMFVQVVERMGFIQYVDMSKE